MQSSAARIFKFLVGIFAVIGVVFTLLLLIVQPWTESAAPASLAVLAPTVTPTLAPTVTPVPALTPLPTRTPDVAALYLAQIKPWYRDVLAWTESLDHEGKVPSTDRDAALAALEQRATDLLAQLHTFTPPPHHVQTQDHLADAMQNCVQAVSYWRQGETGLSNIHGGTCTLGLTLMLDVIGRN